MPQLDRLAYVSQVIWLVAMFFVLYLIMVRTGLPTLYKVLRFRKDKLLLLSGEVVKGEKEDFFVSRSPKGVLSGVVGFMRGIVDGIGKIYENKMEDKRLEEREERGEVRGVLSLKELNIVDDLSIGKLAYESKHVKKGLVEKKVIGA